MSRPEEDEMQESMSGQIPMGRFGRPDEIAAAALFLASDASSYATGVKLPVSGGLGQL
jgi:3-oxoacyl-[acyl-carrier protein] reductase